MTWQKTSFIFYLFWGLKDFCIWSSDTRKQSGTAWNWHEPSTTAFSNIFIVLKSSGICPSAYGSLCSASLQISSVLKRSGTYSRAFGSSSTAFSHMFCVLRWSGINLKGCRHFSTALRYISCILKLIGTSYSSNASRSTASEHIFSVLNLSRVMIKNPGLIPTTLSHIPWVHGTYFSIGIMTCRIKKLIILFKPFGRSRLSFMVHC